MTEAEMVGWHHQLSGHEFEKAPGVGDGQGSLACHSPWGLFQNFPQFVVIHTVKGFGIVNKSEVDVFLELSCFFYIKVGGGCYFCLSHLLKCTTIVHNHTDFNTCYFLQ